MPRADVSSGLGALASRIRHCAAFEYSVARLLRLGAGLHCLQASPFFRNAGGAAMNTMLKAQMLATALDVYFSDPALGGNKIGAPGPIGSDLIDLTKVCNMID